MEPSNAKTNLLQDTTSLLAVLLPIVQIAFIYLPPSLKSLFLQQDAFLGVSLITLVMSYAAIVAYKTKPWFSWVPFYNKKRMQEYNEYQAKVYEVSSASKFVSGEQASLDKINKFLKELDIKAVKRPFRIDGENLLSVCMTILFANALLFLILGLAKVTGWLAILQSTSYFFLIIFLVLILVIYRDTTNNNKRYKDDLKFATTRAIELAIKSNCFTPQPQVKFISTHDNGLDRRNVRVDFQDDEYEICTNSDATKLIYCYKLDPIPPPSTVSTSSE